MMNYRGVCNCKVCSDDCGSILFYKNVLNGNLSVSLIDERKDLQLSNHIFWPHLFGCCFNNDIERTYRLFCC